MFRLRVPVVVRAICSSAGVHAYPHSSVCHQAVFVCEPSLLSLLSIYRCHIF